MRQLKISQKITNRDSIALEKYFKEVSKQETINIDQEAMLAKRIKMGDMAALDKLVTGNLRFVISVAKQYEGFGMSLEDLISEGNIGLIKAANRFDDSRGYKFISYAVFWIRQCMLKALNEHARIVRLPSNQVAQIQKIQAEFAKLEQMYGFEPSEDAIADALSIPALEVRLAMNNQQRHLSLDEPLGEDEDSSAYGLIANHNAASPDDEMMIASLKEELGECLEKLSMREAEIIRMSYGLEGYTPMFIDDIANAMELGRERVRQLKIQALNKMRRMGATKSLRYYL
ncbi:MAG: RNA polymerase sigma factor RpoD/SigA [Chitinophagales bacterium]|nr:RNA polymerase sigma factor RpoD/SigA [Chitinophagales bacterium]